VRYETRYVRVRIPLVDLVNKPWDSTFQ